jgi:MATE family multidrug resistance protein
MSAALEGSLPAVWAARPTRELVRLAWPITVSTLSYSAMTLCGTLFVASVGADELAGVGLAGVVAFALLCFAIGMLRGIKTVVAQARGAGRDELVDDYLGAGVGFALGLGGVALVGGWLLAPLAAGLCASPAAGAFAQEYLRLRILSAPVMLAYCALRETRYGEGDARTPMRASIVGNVLNIVLCAVLVLGLDLGVAGAAIATVIGESSQLAVLAWPARARLVRLRWRPVAARAVWAQGAPTGLQFVMEVGSFLLLTAVVAGMSSADGAAHQLVLQVVNVSFLPAHAIAEAASVLVGQAVGAGRFELVRRVAWRALALGLAYAAACTVVLGVGGGAIVSAMADDVHVAATATALVHVGLVFLLADAANVIARGVLRGAGDVRFAAVVGVLTAWALTPPTAYLLGIRAGWGAAGGWIGLAAEIILGATVFWVRVARGSWRPAADAARAALAATRPAPARHEETLAPGAPAPSARCPRRLASTDDEDSLTRNPLETVPAEVGS